MVYSGLALKLRWILSAQAVLYKNKDFTPLWIDNHIPQSSHVSKGSDCGAGACIPLNGHARLTRQRIVCYFGHIVIACIHPIVNRTQRTRSHVNPVTANSISVTGHPHHYARFGARCVCC